MLSFGIPQASAFWGGGESMVVNLTSEGKASSRSGHVTEGGHDSDR